MIKILIPTIRTIVVLYHRNYVQRKRYVDDDEAIRYCCNQYLKLYLGWLMQQV